MRALRHVLFLPCPDHGWRATVIPRWKENRTDSMEGADDLKLPMFTDGYQPAIVYHGVAV